MFGKNRSRTVGLITLALILTLLIALSIPGLTSAAGPAQAPDPTSPGELSAAVVGFLELLVAFFVVGGGIAYVLQISQTWKEWASPYKPLVVLALSALLGGGLAALKVLATPELFAQAPEWARAFLSFIVVFVGSQFVYHKGFSAPAAQARE